MLRDVLDHLDALRRCGGTKSLTTTEAAALAPASVGARAW
jgi:hypothetical protein